MLQRPDKLWQRTKEKNMKRETEIELAASEAMGSRYDEACKKLFQNREIIAPVLKEVVPEYKDSTIEEIIRYIDADSIQDIPVDDVSARAGQLPTEMGSVSDKLIRYDTHFKAVNPLLSDENLCIHLHIDLDYSDFRFIPINLFKDHFHATSIQVCRNNYSNNPVLACR